jgi:hypothetical protein
MPDSLYVRIDRPLPLDTLLKNVAAKVKQMLRLEHEPKIGIEVPRGSPFSSPPAMIPDRPKWGLYLYLEEIDESLVEAHERILSAQSGPSPTVLCFRELRTPTSKALAAALAIAASEVLNTEILDLEHAWINKGQISPQELEKALTLGEPQSDIQRAARKMCEKLPHH